MITLNPVKRSIASQSGFYEYVFEARLSNPTLEYSYFGTSGENGSNIFEIFSGNLFKDEFLISPINSSEYRILSGKVYNGKEDLFLDSIPLYLSRDTSVDYAEYLTFGSGLDIKNVIVRGKIPEYSKTGEFDFGEEIKGITGSIINNSSQKFKIFNSEANNFSSFISISGVNNNTDILPGERYYFVARPLFLFDAELDFEVKFETNFGTVINPFEASMTAEDGIQGNLEATLYPQFVSMLRGDVNNFYFEYFSEEEFVAEISLGYISGQTGASYYENKYSYNTGIVVQNSQFTGLNSEIYFEEYVSKINGLNNQKESGLFSGYLTNTSYYTGESYIEKNIKVLGLGSGILNYTEALTSGLLTGASGVIANSGGCFQLTINNVTSGLANFPSMTGHICLTSDDIINYIYTPIDSGNLQYDQIFSTGVFSVGSQLNHLFENIPSTGFATGSAISGIITEQFYSYVPNGIISFDFNFSQIPVSVENELFLGYFDVSSKFSPDEETKTYEATGYINQKSGITKVIEDCSFDVFDIEISGVPTGYRTNLLLPIKINGTGITIGYRDSRTFVHEVQPVYFPTGSGDAAENSLSVINEEYTRTKTSRPYNSIESGIFSDIIGPAYEYRPDKFWTEDLTESSFLIFGHENYIQKIESQNQYYFDLDDTDSEFQNVFQFSISNFTGLDNGLTGYKTAIILKSDSVERNIFESRMERPFIELWSGHLQEKNDFNINSNYLINYNYKWDFDSEYVSGLCPPTNLFANSSKVTELSDFEIFKSSELESSILQTLPVGDYTVRIKEMLNPENKDIRLGIFCLEEKDTKDHLSFLRVLQKIQNKSCGNKKITINLYYTDISVLPMGAFDNMEHVDLLLATGVPQYIIKHFDLDISGAISIIESVITDKKYINYDMFKLSNDFFEQPPRTGDYFVESILSDNGPLHIQGVYEFQYALVYFYNRISDFFNALNELADSEKRYYVFAQYERQVAAYGAANRRSWANAMLVRSDDVAKKYSGQLNFTMVDGNSLINFPSYEYDPKFFLWHSSGSGSYEVMRFSIQRRRGFRQGNTYIYVYDKYLQYCWGHFNTLREYTAETIGMFFGVYREGWYVEDRKIKPIDYKTKILAALESSDGGILNAKYRLEIYNLEAVGSEYPYAYNLQGKITKIRKKQIYINRDGQNPYTKFIIGGECPECFNYAKYKSTIDYSFLPWNESQRIFFNKATISFRGFIDDDYIVYADGIPVINQRRNIGQYSLTNGHPNNVSQWWSETHEDLNIRYGANITLALFDGWPVSFVGRPYKIELFANDGVTKFVQEGGETFSLQSYIVEPDGTITIAVPPPSLPPNYFGQPPKINTSINLFTKRADANGQFVINLDEEEIVNIPYESNVLTFNPRFGLATGNYTVLQEVYGLANLEIDMPVYPDEVVLSNSGEAWVSYDTIISGEKQASPMACMFSFVAQETGTSGWAWPHISWYQQTQSGLNIPCIEEIEEEDAPDPPDIEGPDCDIIDCESGIDEAKLSGYLDYVISGIESYMVNQFDSKNNRFSSIKISDFQKSNTGQISFFDFITGDKVYFNLYNGYDYTGLFNSVYGFLPQYSGYEVEWEYGIDFNDINELTNLFNNIPATSIWNPFNCITGMTIEGISGLNNYASGYFVTGKPITAWVDSNELYYYRGNPNIINLKSNIDGPVGNYDIKIIHNSGVLDRNENNPFCFRYLMPENFIIQGSNDESEWQNLNIPTYIDWTGAELSSATYQAIDFPPLYGAGDFEISAPGYKIVTGSKSTSSIEDYVTIIDPTGGEITIGGGCCDEEDEEDLDINIPGITGKKDSFKFKTEPHNLKIYTTGFSFDYSEYENSPYRYYRVYFSGFYDPFYDDDCETLLDKKFFSTNVTLFDRYRLKPVPFFVGEKEICAIGQNYTLIPSGFTTGLIDYQYNSFVNISGFPEKAGEILVTGKEKSQLYIYSPNLEKFPVYSTNGMEGILNIAPSPVSVCYQSFNAPETAEYPHSYYDFTISGFAIENQPIIEISKNLFYDETNEKITSLQKFAGCFFGASGNLFSDGRLPFIKNTSGISGVVDLESSYQIVDFSGISENIQIISTGFSAFSYYDTGAVIVFDQLDSGVKSVIESVQVNHLLIDNPIYYSFPTGYKQATGIIYYNNPNNGDYINIYNGQQVIKTLIYDSSTNSNDGVNYYYSSFSGLLQSVLSIEEINQTSHIQNESISIISNIKGEDGNRISFRSFGSTGATTASGLLGGENYYQEISGYGEFTGLFSSLVTGTGFCDASFSGSIFGEITEYQGDRTFTGEWFAQTGARFNFGAGRLVDFPFINLTPINQQLLSGSGLFPADFQSPLIRVTRNSSGILSNSLDLAVLIVNIPSRGTGYSSIISGVNN